MNVTVYVLNVFSAGQNGGNPAGVVLNADDLTDEQKKHIAKEIGFSETAFLQKSEKADYKVTFFTPTEEVDLCGHATIATYALLFTKKLTPKGEYTQELKAGMLKITITDDGTVTMDQTLPVFSETMELEKITDIFSIQPEIITQTGLVPQIVSTGLRDILLPIHTREALFSLKPNFEKMIQLNKETDTVGFHAFTLDTIHPDAIAHCRNFAPLYGINEEAATGSSSGALACYLYKYNKLTDKNLGHLIFEQGYSMDKPSEIVASMSVENNEITQVQIGGKASIIGEKTINL